MNMIIVLALVVAIAVVGDLLIQILLAIFDKYDDHS
jgi:hypothetical protein